MPAPVLRTRGFTLVEILVAVLVFAVLSVLGYQALDNVVELERRQLEDYAEDARIQRAWSLMLNDFIHLRGRPVRDLRGGQERAYEVPGGEFLVRFTRGGLPPLPAIPGGVQRVAYDVSQAGELRRWSWPAADQADGSEPVAQVLLAGVDSLLVEQLDESNFFTPHWPPLDVTRLPPAATPRMIRLRLRMENGFELERLLPGVQQP